MYKTLITTLLQKKSLSSDQIAFFIQASEEGKLTPVMQAAFLTALQGKGVTSQELSEFAKQLQRKTVMHLSFPLAIDICGTGGSGLSRINTSTIAAFILSALRIPVAKHGNKAGSGRFGSFDLLESLGININVPEENLKLLFQDLNLCFLFARTAHPVFKHFAHVRTELSFPTLFNLLGPLLNPARTTMQIIGTSFHDKMDLIAQTAKKLGKKRVMVVCGEDRLDEVTLTGKTKILELDHGKIRTFFVQPKSFGIPAATFTEIKGGDAKTNTEIALSILKGDCKTRHLDLVLVNVALALKLAGKVKNLKKAYILAKECVESGAAYQKFLQYQRLSHAPSILLQIASHKRKEVEKRKKKLPLQKLKKIVKPSIRDFSAALLRGKPSLIAEIKYRSPASGSLTKNDKSVVTMAKVYENSGAQAISIVTDEHYFAGSLNNLEKARSATSVTPILCKDFIIDEYQIYEARHFGADAILLIVSILSKDQIQQFLDIAQSLKMAAIVEVHTEEELRMALSTTAAIIGINNRDLHTFEVHLLTTKKLAPLIPDDKIIISESGISSAHDLKKLSKRIDAVLMGTALMKSKNPAQLIRSLIGPTRPLVKYCGIRSLRDAIFCQESGVDYIGLNFVPKSHRFISLQKAAEIIRTLREQKKSKLRIVGIFQDQELSDVNSIAQQLDLDYIQLSGNELVNYVKKCVKPVIKGISIRRKSDFLKIDRYRGGISSLILDGKKPGAGKPFDHSLLKKIKTPFLLAGGLSLDNLKTAMSTVHPFGIDVASGIETGEQIDQQKMKKIIQMIT